MSNQTTELNPLIKTETINESKSITTQVLEQKQELNLIAVPVSCPNTSNNNMTPTKSNNCDITPTSITQSTSTTTAVEYPSTSRAIVPLSTSLPSKLLRLHAKRSAQALLEQNEQQHSLDSQFGSDEGATGGSSSSEYAANDSDDLYDIPSPTTPPMTPPAASSTPIECFEDNGVGSSIDDSEESEEDDELKPLAVDNHIMHDVDLNSPSLDGNLMSPLERSSMSSSSSSTNNNGQQAAVLSEANLEKFHKNQSLTGGHYTLNNNNNNNNNQHHHMDNIYLHPNFKYELDDENKVTLDNSSSPPPFVLNSPTEQKRVHRSFLTMKSESVDNDDDKIVAPPSSPNTGTQTESITNDIEVLDPALAPSEELAAEIAEAVEYYFSNDSILKDAFLLKHVRRNKEGFVSLKLVSSFKRVRQLTKEWKVVGNAVRRKSRKIELNDLGTKVRRIEPLPNFDETMPSRTIVACDLPLDKLSIEKVSDIFSKCGEIALIRILKPGMAIPVDVRQFMNKYPEMQQKECALVEYLESSSAREAKNLQGPFTVFEMVAPKKKTGKKAIIQVAAPVARMVENYRYYNDATYERTRGGSFSGVIPHDNTDLRFKLKRNNSDYPIKAEMHHNNMQHFQHHHAHHQHQHSPTHCGSFSSANGEHTHQFQYYQPRNSVAHEAMSPPPSSHSGNVNYFNYTPRRYSNTSTISANTAAISEHTTNVVPLNSATSNHNNNNNNNNVSNNVSCNNNSNVANNNARRISNCSDNFSGFTEMSRRASNCSENMPHRRESNCSENCPCSRRVSDFGQNENYRKISQCSNGSVGERRFSNGSLHYERTYSNANELCHNNNNNNNNNQNINSNSNGGGNGGGFPRRMSNDFNYERKPNYETQTSVPYDNIDGNVGGGGGGYQVFPRRYSNNFNLSNKMAAYDNAQYINGRRISTDSGYDRRYSFGSEYEGSPRSRTGSFLNNYKNNGDFDGQPRSRTGSFLDGTPRSRSGSLAQRNAENLLRTPIGPDGSKGFATRARKFGQAVSPVN